MKLTKLFVGAFALTTMLVACDSDSASAKDTEIEELSSSSAEKIASSSSTIRKDSMSSSAIESSSSSAIEIASSSSTIRNDSSSSSAMETSSSSAVEIASSSSTTRNDSMSSSAIESSSSSVMESSSSSAIEIASSSSTIRNDNSSSSSETTQSSSSSENISAGSVYDATAKTLTDLRDGQTYKTVTIGDQTWMAENLNYAYTGVPASDSMSWCYDNDPANCAKYGRLYTWAAAMDSVGTWSTDGKGCGYGSTCSPTGAIRGICPEGWHLPDTTEWNTLFTAVGGQSTAGKVLKSQTGWDDSGNGTDAFGFSALPAGLRDDNGGYDNEGSHAFFWSSTESYSYYAYYMFLYYYDDYAYLYLLNKYYGRSVRCVKD